MLPKTRLPSRLDFFALLWLSAPAFAVPSWTPLGPSGGDLNQVLVAPSNPRTVYAANPSEIFVSTDGGASWRSKFRPFENQPVHLLAVDPRDPTRLFALFRHDGTLLVDLGGGRGIGLALLDAEANSLAFVSPRSTSTDGLLVGASDGLYLRSSGSNWKRAGLRGRRTSHVAVSPHDSKLWFAIELTEGNPRFSLGQLLRSTDAGKSWSESSLPTGGSFAVGAPLFDPRDSNVIYQLAGHLRVSRDRGQTWSETGTSITPFKVEISPSDGRLVAATTSGLITSRDRGETWSALGGAPRSGPPDQVQDLSLSKNPREVFASGQRGLWRTTDFGNSWQARSEGIFRQSASSISQSLDGRTLYLGVPAEGVFRADLSAPRPARGLAWTRKSSGLPADPTRAREFQSHVEADRAELDKVWNLSSKGLFVSENRGDSWRRVPLDGFSAQHRGGVIEIDRNNPRRLVVSAVLLSTSNPTGLAWLSEDGGLSWRKLGLSEESPLSGLAFEPTDPQRLWAATQSGFLTSHDQGRTWLSLQAALPPSPLFPSVTGVWADPNESGSIYVALGSYGFFESSDGGATYQPVWVGTPGQTPIVHDLEFDTVDQGAYFVRAQPLDGSGRTRSEIWKFSAGGEQTERLNTSRAPTLANDFVLDPNDPFRLFTASEIGAFEVDFRP